MFFSYRIQKNWRKSSKFSTFCLLRDTNIYVYSFSHTTYVRVPNSLSPAPQGTVFKNLIVQISISSSVDLSLWLQNLRYLKICQKIRQNEIHFLFDLQSIIYSSTVLQYRMHRPILVLLCTITIYTVYRLFFLRLLTSQNFSRIDIVKYRTTGCGR